MPLRDHFHPPFEEQEAWECFHAQWPAMIVLALGRILPTGYKAVPRIHAGSLMEVDVSTWERGPQPRTDGPAGGTAVQVVAPPSQSVATDLAMADVYEVQIVDTRRNRRLVAAIEIVSPSNKDRPVSRRSFVAKCVALLQNGVSVIVVDLVTYRHFNLFGDLMDFVGQSSTIAATPIYAVAARFINGDTPGRLDVWEYALVVGQPLPPLPLWLSPDTAVTFDLEATYEDTCRALFIP